MNEIYWGVIMIIAILLQIPLLALSWYLIERNFKVSKVLNLLFKNDADLNTFIKNNNHAVRAMIIFATLIITLLFIFVVIGLLNIILKPNYFNGFNFDFCWKSLVALGVLSEFVSRVGVRDKFIRK